MDGVTKLSARHHAQQIHAGRWNPAGNRLLQLQPPSQHGEPGEPAVPGHAGDRGAVQGAVRENVSGGDGGVSEMTEGAVLTQPGEGETGSTPVPHISSDY
jgi:hypothetical protein